MSWPNRITLARMLLIPFFVMTLMQVEQIPVYRYVALVIFAVAAFLDVVDGIVARRTHQATNLGRLLDPLADKLLMNTAYVLLASRIWPVHLYHIPRLVVVAVISRDVFLVFGYLIVHTFVGNFRADPSGLGKLTTIAQFTAIVGTLLTPDLPRVLLPWVMSILYGMAVVLTVGSGVDYIYTSVKQLEDQ